MRLQKYLARAGISSRRRAEKMIINGMVRVNGKVIRTMGYCVNPEIDEVTVNNFKVCLNTTKMYILLYKPPGYVTTVHDPQGRPKVMDLVKGIRERIYPVGRLDFETEGLLLLTNDGDLAMRLTHPRYRIPKTYLAWVQGIPHEQAINQLRHGVRLSDCLTAPAVVNVIEASKGRALLEMVLSEGRKREVRRMLAAVGYPVIRLKRTHFAFLDLRGLKQGEYRHLRKKEVIDLYRLVRLA